MTKYCKRLAEQLVEQILLPKSIYLKKRTEKNPEKVSVPKQLDTSKPERSTAGHLGTDKTFSKDSPLWTDCVVPIFLEFSSRIVQRITT